MYCVWEVNMNIIRYRCEYSVYFSHKPGYHTNIVCISLTNLAIIRILCVFLSQTWLSYEYCVYFSHKPG